MLSLSLPLDMLISLSLSFLTLPLITSRQRLNSSRGWTRWHTRSRSDFWGSQNVRTHGVGPRHYAIDGEGLHVAITLHMAHCHWFGRPWFNCPGDGEHDPKSGERWLSRKWPEHSGGMDHGFKWSFLYPRSSPRLEIGMYQLVSMRRSIWYIYIYINCLYLVLFGKSCIFREKLWKLLV